MTNCLHFARRFNNDTAVAQIERIIMREESGHTWERLGCATKKKRSPAASQCAILDEDGQRTVITGQEPFQNAAA